MEDITRATSKDNFTLQKEKANDKQADLVQEEATVNSSPKTRVEGNHGSNAQKANAIDEVGQGASIQATEAGGTGAALSAKKKG